jgi:hypothetical protein
VKGKLKILVGTKETQGQRENDFTWTEENEPVYWTFECDRDNKNIDGMCGCRRSLSGIYSRKGTTTFKVVETDWTRKQWLEEVSTAERKAWGDLADEFGVDTYLLDIARKLPVGTILEKRGSRIRVRQEAIG